MEEIQQEEKKHNGNDIFHIKEKIYEMILYGNPQLKDFLGRYPPKEYARSFSTILRNLDT